MRCLRCDSGKSLFLLDDKSCDESSASSVVIWKIWMSPVPYNCVRDKRGYLIAPTGQHMMQPDWITIHYYCDSSCSRNLLMSSLLPSFFASFFPVLRDFFLLFLSVLLFFLRERALYFCRSQQTARAKSLHSRPPAWAAALTSSRARNEESKCGRSLNLPTPEERPVSSCCFSPQTHVASRFDEQVAKEREEVMKMA